MTSWTFSPGVILVLLLTLILYWRGWRILRRTVPTRLPAWRFFAFLGGLIALWIAIASPLDAFSGFLLSAHMVQHLLLLSVAPPLILLGAPLLPLLRGLPGKIARDGLGPFLVWPGLRRVGHGVTQPVFCWMVMACTLCCWHIPAAFDLTLRSLGWHKAEHVCFLVAALLFWWPVVQPFPMRPHWPLWTMPVYLLAADLLNTVISAILTFSDHILYKPYAEVPRLFGTTALGDQSCAGAIMWVPGSFFFLVPAVVIAAKCLSPKNLIGGRKSVAPKAHLPTIARGSMDVLALPLAGRMLRALATRRILQSLLLILAVAVIVDGLFGPQVGAFNLAGVLPWIYWRALAVVALLAAGNFFCMACPFMLFREAGRRLGLTQRAWPVALRSKWFSIALLLLFFWAYEYFRLWDKPIWTAWLVINYFLIAFAIDALFRGASFCKYVCPIGQFQFMASLVSPLEVKVRAADVCASCKTHDCLRGNETHRGCEMALYLPKKTGNMDCTFCLDCVRACPHDNIGIHSAPPKAELGRFANRTDITVLALIFVFAAFANAAVMTPVAVGAVSCLGAVALGTVAFALLCGDQTLMGRFAASLVPLGAAMWAGHYLFHLNAGWASAWTAIRRGAGGINVPPLLGADAFRDLQAALLDAGLLLTLYLAWRVARNENGRLRAALRSYAPWAIAAAALYAIGIWLILQPMQMRGLPGT